MTDKFKPEAGVMYKSASIAAQELSEDEMRAINKYSVEPLTADEVYVFRAALCDTELDRQFEYFTPKALSDMQRLFLGKTVIKDHNHTTDNQVARIYDTEIVETGKTVKSTGEPYMQLVAKCYMVKTASNADLIAEIKGGIRREGSVGFAASSAICSVCGTDNVKAYCRHWPGKSYDKEGGKQVCTFKLDSVSDAYEFSFVSVPAQRAAGVTKSYTGEVVNEKDFPEEVPETPEQEEPTVDTEGAMLRLRARMAAIEAIYRRNNND